MSVRTLVTGCAKDSAPVSHSDEWGEITLSGQCHSDECVDPSWHVNLLQYYRDKCILSVGLSSHTTVATAVTRPTQEP
eukprot:scaffold408897_cov83-Attheya_sp.AAC.2